MSVNPNITPITMPLDANGHPLPQATIGEDRILPLAAVVTVAAGALTSDPTANLSSAIRVDDVGQAVLWVNTVLGTATKIRVRLYFDYQPTGTFAYREPSESVVGGVSTIVAHEYETAVLAVPIPIVLNGMPWMKVGVAGPSGETLTTTTVAVRVTRSAVGA